MKKIGSIVGINFIILLVSILLLSSIDNPKYEFIYFIPVVGLVGFNLIRSLICYIKGDKSLAKTFILSSLIILIIGGSSCVSIKLKPKHRHYKKIEKKAPGKAVEVGLNTYQPKSGISINY